jgi:probable HAF family extracellular repeat protein
MFRQRGVALFAVCVLALVLVAGAALASQASGAPAPMYSVTDLGTLGGSASFGMGINNQGSAVGLAETGTGAAHAFLFSDRTREMRDIGTLGGDFSQAAAINERGQIVGVSETTIPFGPFSFEQHAFLYDHGEMHDLGTLGGVQSTAYGINDRGDIVGTSLPSGASSGHEHAFLFSDGVMADLGTLGASASTAFDVNNRGDVVGVSALVDFDFTHAFLYSDGVMHDLGTLAGGNGSEALAVNERGEITGDAGTPTGTHAFLYQDGVMQDLGTLPGFTQSAGLGINERGDVVGTLPVGIGPEGQLLDHAFIYSGGVMRDLNDLIPTGAGWLLNQAVDINARGEIVGSGVIDGDTHAFLLSPQ